MSDANVGIAGRAGDCPGEVRQRLLRRALLQRGDAEPGGVGGGTLLAAGSMGCGHGELYRRDFGRRQMCHYQ